MRLVKASEAQKLTGLSADQLREWTTRRGLIEPDSKPNGPGSRARYSWQTVLLLRLAVVLKDSFHIELHAQRTLFSTLAERLAKTSFPALRESALVIGPDGIFSILPVKELRSPASDVLMILLDPHLDILSTEFGLIEPIRQLPLFPARVVGSLPQ
jgi:DNA-binding transcriptional MerR regulator